MSRRLKIPKSTTHVLISTLDQLGYVRRCQSTRRFHLSTKMFGLARDALAAISLPQMSFPHLCKLVQETRLTAHLGILEKTQVVFIQKLDGPGMIKFDTYVGKCSKLHCTALGKALLAFQADAAIEPLLSNYSFDRFTKRTISTKDALLTELERVRQQGYALDDEEEELGVRCIAVPILSSVSILAAISVTGTTAQIQFEDIQKLVNLTRSAAHNISAALSDEA